MILAPIPSNEVERLAAVRALHILDTPDEERFDRITDAMTKIFDVPVAFMGVMDANRQWIKSKKGMQACEARRDTSLCGHALLADDVFVIEDTLADARFADNPMVVEEPHVRFYVGQPLFGPEGHRIGTLSIADVKPRMFGPKEKFLLKILAGIIEKEMELTDVIRLQSDLITTKQNLIESRERLDKELREAESYIKSLLPQPMNEPAVAMDWHFMPSSDLGGDAFGYGWIDENRFYLYMLDVAGHGVGAALLSVSIMNTMRSRTLSGVDFASPQAVLRALNDAYHMECHDGRYFSMWYGVFDRRDRSLVYASAGHPPALLVSGNSAEDNRIHELGHGGLAVGLLNETDFESGRMTLGKYARLYVFSDGIYESQHQDGEMGSYQEWLDYLSVESLAKDFSIKKIISYIHAGRTGESFNDDVSILEATFK